VSKNTRLLLYNFYRRIIFTEKKKSVEIAECDVSVFPIIAFAVNVSLWQISRKGLMPDILYSKTCCIFIRAGNFLCRSMNVIVPLMFGLLYSLREFQSALKTVKHSAHILMSVCCAKWLQGIWYLIK